MLNHMDGRRHGSASRLATGRRNRILLPVLACLAAMTLAPTASATFHRISIREVYPGTASEPGAEYVELQMWSSGQELVGAHTLRTYSAAGSPKATVLPSDVSNGANQSTVLIGTAEAAANFGVDLDATLSSSGQLSPAGGAVCWEDVDCVSWGSFSGALTSPAGGPAAAIADGMALRRTIAPGCPTLLEASDDHNDSAADFISADPAPRPNSVAPSERACPSSGTGGNPDGDGGGGSIRVTLKRKPPRKTRDRTPTFRFVADEPGVTLQCKLDGKPFRPCRSPFTTKKLSLGRHVFRVRARDDSGRLDPGSASYAFRVIRGQGA